MTISLQTQTQSTSNFQATSSAPVNSMKKEAPVASTPAVDTTSSFEITDVYESSADTAASTNKYATYSNITSVIRSNQKAAASTEAPASAVSSAASQILSSSEGSSSVSLLASSTEDSEEDETTELVYNADGSVYEKTTTTDEDGNETLTMTKISDGNSDTDANITKALTDTASQALSSQQTW